jgi:drug/metabolite transporter (DMT)-like permease
VRWGAEVHSESSPQQRGTVTALNNQIGANRPYRATGASLIVIVLALLCFGSVMSLHAMRGDMEPLRRVMSEYANGSHGMVMTFVFYAFGLSSVALAFRLRRGMDRRGPAKFVPLMLALAGVGLIAAGVFEVERPQIPDTLEEVIHSNASVVAFVLLVAAMLLFSLACRTDPRWWSFRWISTTLAVAAAVAAMASPLSDKTGLSGGVQRLLAGSVLLWFLLTALHVRKRAFRQT